MSPTPLTGRGAMGVPVGQICEHESCMSMTDETESRKQMLDNDDSIENNGRRHDEDRKEKNDDD